MISRIDIEERVREWGLREDIIEKDYVRSGGFLHITISPGVRPTATLRFHDEQGVLLHAVEKVAR